jgi:protocatechuate 3,4-dioxygenase beta subunit
MKVNALSRRKLLMATGAIAANATILTACEPTPACPETESNPLGPYYRPDAPVRSVLASPTDGQRLVISGMVRGTDCRAVEGALLDVWHCSADGVYDLERPEFLWRGRLFSQIDGLYRFETVLPGRYLNGSTYRPRHIHLMIQNEGFKPLVTQLYFAGDPFLSSDGMVLPSLIIPLDETSEGLHGTFDLTLALSS